MTHMMEMPNNGAAGVTTEPMKFFIYIDPAATMREVTTIIRGYKLGEHYCLSSYANWNATHNEIVTYVGKYINYCEKRGIPLEIIIDPVSIGMSLINEVKNIYNIPILTIGLIEMTGKTFHLNVRDDPIIKESF